MNFNELSLLFDDYMLLHIHPDCISVQLMPYLSALDVNPQIQVFAKTDGLIKREELAQPASFYKDSVYKATIGSDSISPLSVYDTDGDQYISITLDSDIHQQLYFSVLEDFKSAMCYPYEELLYFCKNHHDVSNLYIKVNATHPSFFYFSILFKGSAESCYDKFKQQFLLLGLYPMVHYFNGQLNVNLYSCPDEEAGFYTAKTVGLTQLFGPLNGYVYVDDPVILDPLYGENYIIVADVQAELSNEILQSANVNNSDQLAFININNNFTNIYKILYRDGVQTQVVYFIPKNSLHAKFLKLLANEIPGYKDTVLNVRRALNNKLECISAVYSIFGTSGLAIFNKSMENEWALSEIAEDALIQAGFSLEDAVILDRGYTLASGPKYY